MSFYARYAGIFGGGGGGGGGTAPLANKVALASGAQTGTVTFGTPFVAPPVVVGWITSSNASADLISVIGTTPTTTGFDYTLSTQTPDTTYTFHWIASAVNA